MGWLYIYKVIDINICNYCCIISFLLSYSQNYIFILYLLNIYIVTKNNKQIKQRYSINNLI